MDLRTEKPISRPEGYDQERKDACGKRGAGKGKGTLSKGGGISRPPRTTGTSAKL